MKNFILVTVSSVAFLAAAGANAQQESTAPTMPDQAMEKTPPAAPMHKEMAHKKSHKHKHYKHKHHKHHGMTMHPTQIKGIYVTFPPADECGRPVCTPAYYWSNPQWFYQYHGGYFWYPRAHGNLLTGYTPYFIHGRYWYASRMHPHMVYVDRTPLVYVHPYPLHMAHPRDGVVYPLQSAPMQQKWESSPTIKPVEEY